MKVLGIETATTVCAVALLGGEEILSEALLDKRNVHAERLLGQIAQVLDEAAVAVSSLDGIAVSIGPGSFTGLRIGLSVAKGLAYAHALPLVGVSTLEALTHHAIALDPPGEGEYILAALDARRDEVYCQIFTVNETGLTAHTEVRDMTMEELRAVLHGKRALVVGDATEKVLRSLGAASVRGASPAAARCSASSVARLGGRLLQGGQRDDVASLEPRYIKEFFLKTR